MTSKHIKVLNAVFNELYIYQLGKLLIYKYDLIG